MKIQYFDLRPQYKSIQADLQAAIADVLATGLFVLGEQGLAFEREFAAYCGVAHAVGVASGTDAIWLGLVALGVEPDDEVITAANTAFPTIAAICKAGARPVLVDVDLETYNMDPTLLPAAITGRTKVILPVHLYGRPAEMQQILAVARDRGIRVMEDACQAHGALYRGRKTGSLAEAAAFSFYPTKNLGAYGDGGMMLTDDAEVAARVRALRDYGQKTRYDHASLGYNSRLDELQAAVLRVKLRHLDEWNASRRRKAALYSSLLRGVVTPAEANDHGHVYHLYVVRHPARDDLRGFLAERGVGTLIHYPKPAHLQPAWSGMGLPQCHMPAAERCSAEVLSLPLYPELTDDDVATVAGTVNLFSSGSV